MAVRVRKLARELNRSADEVLGLLHAIGFDRYRSADDMLPDAMVEAVRRAVRERVQPVAIAAAASRAENRAAEPVIVGGDLMSRLVPGVVRVGRTEPDRRVPAPARSPEPAKPTAQPTVKPHEDVRVASAMRSAVDAERSAVDAERDMVRREVRQVAERDLAMQSERDRLAAEWATLAEERVSVARAREAVAREREDLARDRSVARPTSSTGTTLADLLTNRGLRGLDECERAVGALASARLLGDLLVRLKVDDADLVERFLRDRLVLVAGDAPVGIGAAAVTVAPERAEVADGAAAMKAIARIGDSLMMAGLRRVLFVGGRPAWHKLLRAHLDARLEVKLLPGSPRGRAEAEQDVLRTDVVALWGVAADAAAREVYGQSRAVVVFVEQDNVTALANGIAAGLAG